MSPPDRAVWIYDDVCVLCSAAVRWTIRRDPEARIAFASAQGPLGQSLYRSLGLSTEVFDSFLFVKNDRIRTRSDAVVALLDEIGGFWRLCAVLLRLVPRPLRDAGYGWLARNRYRLFGRRNQCLVPDAAMRSRFLD